MKPRKQARHLPPLMHYGWIVDLDRMWDLAVKLKSGTFYHCIDGPREREYWGTLECLMRPLLEHLDLPYDKRVVARQFSNGDVDPDDGKVLLTVGLSLGTNYAGRLSEERVKKIRDLVAPGVEPRWFLDVERWKWTKNKNIRGANPGA